MVIIYSCESVLMDAFLLQNVRAIKLYVKENYKKKKKS